MDIESTYSFFSNLNDDNISFMYQGSFSDAITDKAAQIGTTNLDMPKDTNSLKKSVSVLMAECLYNLVRQGESSTPSFISKPGIFLTRNIADTFCTTSAYLIENSFVDGLKNRLDHLNHENMEEFYSFFSDMVKKSGISEKKDMMQKIIELARKSGNRLEYAIEPAGETWSYLFLQTIIGGLNVTPETLTRYNLHIDTAREFYKKMRDKNIFLIYKGDFTQKSVIAILRLLEKNMQQTQFENISERKIMFHIITELLQNISRHSVAQDGKKKGIFLVGKNVKGFFISTGNFVEHEKARKLKDQVNQINSLEAEERNSLYRVILKTGVLTGNGGAGLGLIDIARETKGKFVYKLTDIDNNITFFSLGVNYS